MPQDQHQSDQWTKGLDEERERAHANPFSELVQLRMILKEDARQAEKSEQAGDEKPNS